VNQYVHGTRFPNLWISTWS